MVTEAVEAVYDRRHAISGLEMVYEPINDWNHAISIGHRQGTAREKVVLNIDHEQRVHETDITPSPQKSHVASSGTQIAGS